ncbi:MAG: hypothetical protein LAT57_00100 [Balneolales bacterium]|nr:hypothetical protein [Balneolales bacterium]
MNHPVANTPSREIRTALRRIDYKENSGRLLEPNGNRVGLIIENDTDTAMFVAFGTRTPSPDYRNFSLPARTVVNLLDVPADQLFKGPLTYSLANPSSGRVFVTELTREHRSA